MSGLRTEMAERVGATHSRPHGEPMTKVVLQPGDQGRPSSEDSWVMLSGAGARPAIEQPLLERGGFLE